MVIKNGIEIVSNQVCFLLLDICAAADLSKVAEAHNVSLLTFDTLGGDFCRISGQGRTNWQISWIGAG